MSDPIDGESFLKIVRPALETADAGKLAQLVGTHWRPEQLRYMLRSDNVDVRRVAAVTLGLVGDTHCTPSLIRALRDMDEQVNQMAEHGLWSIWFRSGKPQATQPFHQGVALLTAENYQSAVDRFHEALRQDPDFAEAFNQCAIAHYFLGNWKESIADCDATIRRVPHHFGAICGMGHCYAQLDDLHRALRCYKHALRINPRMTTLERAINQLLSQQRDLNASGEFLVDQFNN